MDSLFVAFLIFLSCFQCDGITWDISLKIERRIQHGVGGEAFIAQPIISIFNLEGVNKYVDLLGRVVATLHHRVFVDELLGTEVGGRCAHEGHKNGVSVDVVSGNATFSKLCVNRAGNDYSIKYKLLDEYNITLGEAIEEGISIDPGEPFTVGVIRMPAVVEGGVTWSINPQVALQDRGKNTVTTVNNGTVSVKLADNKRSENLTFEILHDIEFEDTFQVISPDEHQWDKGVAEFGGLSIKTANAKYQLNFTTGVDLPGGCSCLSDSIIVRNGPPRAFLVKEEPHLSNVYGGKAFVYQPLLNVVDAGGNVVKDDSSSKVIVSLYSNPNHGSLLPSEMTIADVSKGKVQFRNVFIDKAGKGYRLKYTLLIKQGDGFFEDTNITELGKPFDVQVGLPQGLKVIQEPTKTFAGNQPFQVQPKIALVDAGGNTLSHLSDIDVEAIVVESLSKNSGIVVDTRLDPVPVVHSVRFDRSIIDDNFTSYSSGHNISIVVSFSQEVFVSPQSKDLTESMIVPTLTLNVTNSAGSFERAHLSQSFPMDSPSREVHFVFQVDVNSTQTLVDILDEDALEANGYFIRDAWFRNASLSLPSHNSTNTLVTSKVITVHRNPATILQIHTNVTDGEYGAGHVIDFDVEFSHKVSVFGIPHLPLKIQSYLVVIDTNKLGTSLSKSYFYIWYKNERSESILWDFSASLMKLTIEKMAVVSGTVCVSRARSLKSYKSGGFRWAIRFDGMFDDLRGGFGIEHAAVTLGHEAINTSTTFYQSDQELADWTDNDGKDDMCTYRYAKYSGGSGTNHLNFRFVILPGDATSKVNFALPASVTVEDTMGVISNSLNNGTLSKTPADLVWHNPSALSIGNITIDTTPPCIIGLIVSGTADLNQTFHAGDSIDFKVTFDRPITITGDVRMRLNIKYTGGFAKYHSQPDTNSTLFRYVVMAGDWTPDLKIREDPQALITYDTNSFVRRDSENPSTAANLTLPWLVLATSPQISIDGRPPRVKEVYLSQNQFSTNFGRGDQIFVEVTFTSPVVFFDGPPTIAVSASGEFREAAYDSGNQSSTVVFKYTVATGDNSPPPLICDMLCIASGCLEGVSREGYIFQWSANPNGPADTSIPKKQSVLNRITINTTNAPSTKVLSVSSWHGDAVVSAGEVVRVKVTFSDNVYCKGTYPELRLNIPSNAHYEGGSGTRVLTFWFRSALLDSVGHLDWDIDLSNRSAIICTDTASRPCSIANANGIPADLTFMDAHGNHLVDSIPETLAINTTKPSVTAIYVSTPNVTNCGLGGCNLTAGDGILVFTKFDLPVSVGGQEPYISLSVRDENGDNIYAVYDSLVSNDTDLAFWYEVKKGHSSGNFPVSFLSDHIYASEMVDESSTLKAMSTFPLINANIDLPLSNGSIVQNIEGYSLYVDGISIPTIRRIKSGNETGTYSPGDRIVISIEYDHYVSVIGSPLLLLDVGHGMTGCATYFGGDNTKELFFEYDVLPSHCTTLLDIIDRNSLETNPIDRCNNEASSIRRASVNPIIAADLCLPDPGTNESLSLHSTLSLDCRKPYISKIWSIQDPGKYHTNDVISIMVEFSREVHVTGSPMLLLETGLNDRKAIFTSQMNESILEFQYTIQLGDFTENLEYWADDIIERTSLGAFHLGGGSILIPATNPITHADTHINPSYGSLNGRQTNTIVEGEAEYLGLKIGKRGSNYKVRFGLSISGNRFETETSISVEESCEFQLTGNDRDRNPGDKFGSSVAIDNDLLAVGAPHKKVPSAEVQVLRIQSDVVAVENEIQLITTQLNTDDAIKQVQSFHTSASENATISGSFSLRYMAHNNYTYSSTVRFSADVDATYMKNKLMEVFPMVGPLNVTRDSNLICKCKNGWTWSITFFDASGGISPMTTDGFDLTGSGSQISKARIVLPTNTLAGYIILQNPFTNDISRNIAYNSSAMEMKRAIEEDLNINVLNVLVANIGEKDMPELGRRWTIEFSDHNGQFGKDINVPNLIVDDSSLTGSGAKAWRHVHFEGKSPLSGSLAFSFRESPFSSYVSYDASAEELRQALESLESINTVTVSERRSLSSVSGFSWTITFNSINVLSEYGWLSDPGASSSFGNLGPLEVDSHLIGWNTKVKVEYEFGSGSMDTQGQWMAKNMGSDGTNRGEVAIYQQVAAEWLIEDFLRASDGDENDDFGHSLSLNGNMIAIGSPFKEVTGVSEQQTFVCHSNVTSGTFVLTFRGMTSAKLSYNSTSEDVRRAIQGIYGDTTNIHSLPQFDLETSEYWTQGSNSFCSGTGENNFTITMITPDGGGTSTTAHASADIEAFVVDQSDLVGGTVRVEETRKGTRSLSGLSNTIPLGHQSGAVYVYQRHKSCAFCKFKWKEIEKITALNAMEKPQDSSQFGWTVAIQNGVLLVGSPGYDNNAGKVYHFRKIGTRLKYLNSLTNSFWEAQKKGDRFGHAIAMHGDTVLVSSPGYNSLRGAIFVFRQALDRQEFLLSQSILGPPELGLGASFGHAMAINHNQCIICAPFGMDQSKMNIGSCFFYERMNKHSHFLLKQKLTPSNIRKNDRFGWSVGISQGKIIVGQLENFTGKLVPESPVQIVTTYCGLQQCPQHISSTFQLSWRAGSLKTRALSHSISAKQLKLALEEDLETGVVHVTRSKLPDSNRGFRWAITFVSFGYYSDRSNTVPKMECDSRGLMGSMPLCKVDAESDTPNNIRGKVHLFSNREGSWVEQAYLFPTIPQRQDLFGASVALNEKYAIVGSPNRNLLNINSGAATVFDLSFANLYFNASSYSIREGDLLALPIHKVHSSGQIIAGFKSLEANADDDIQDYVSALWGINPTESIPGMATPTEKASGNLAFSRDQYYGGADNRSEWINGMFDYRGVNDYQSIDETRIVDSQTDVVVLRTTDDQIYEAPNEKLSVQVSLPGMFASPLGDLKVDIVIEDDGDGIIRNETHYTKIFFESDDLPPRNHFGSDVCILEEEGLLVIGDGMFTAHENSTNSGIAHLHIRKSDSRWRHLLTLLPLEGPKSNGHFGQSVRMKKPYGRDDVTIIIGEPGQVSAHIFVYNVSSEILEHQETLRPFNETFVTVEHGFAKHGSIDIDGDLAFIGAPKLETVFVYRRIFDNAAKKFTWYSWTKLRSLDYDFDQYDNGFSVQHIHEQMFGTAVESSKRLLIISAPHSDYGNRGSTALRELFDTNGVDNRGLGKGKAFVFRSTPHVLKVVCSFDKAPSHGSFILFDKETNFSTSFISTREGAEHLKSIVEQAPLVGEVSIEYIFSNGTNTEVSWSIAFLDVVVDSVPQLEPLWYGSGCDNCEPFRKDGIMDIHPNIRIEVISAQTSYAQESELQGSDITSGDSFGYSVDIDDDQAVIGAPFSSAKTRTTWDFETGDLIGWIATGDAFDFQPTYGDNSRRRMVYTGPGRPENHGSGDPQSSLVRGRYYIGTYEQRPGNDTNFLRPHSAYQEGDIQGDLPMGTLTSDPFTIEGDSISFLIGGGCNHLKEYIELLVDGFATMRSTGQCNERMGRLHWDIAIYRNRAAQIKIVDASQGHWGHINIDDIRFSWDLHGNRGERSNTGGALSHPSDGTRKQHYSSKEQSAKSGAAYIFKRHCADWTSIQTGERCEWKQQRRLVPSDKRTGNLFGASVSINSAQGAILVGSLNASAYGFLKETPSVHPFNESPLSFPIIPNAEEFMKSGDTLAPTPGNLRVINQMLQNITRLPVILPLKFSESAGAVYVFLQSREIAISEDSTAKEELYWKFAEDAKIAPPDIKGNVFFGSSIGMSGTTALIGASSGQGAFLFGLKWQRARFAKIEYIALEGTDDEIVIDVIRDDHHLDTPMVVGYSTSDLTALGVDKQKVDSCRLLPVEERQGCGDYQQSSGSVEFEIGENLASFIVRIVDDNCWERHMKYVQLNLHVPGGAAIQGEHFRAQLRIDDDDWNKENVCLDGIS